MMRIRLHLLLPAAAVLVGYCSLFAGSLAAQQKEGAPAQQPPPPVPAPVAAPAAEAPCPCPGPTVTVHQDYVRFVEHAAATTQPRLVIRPVVARTTVADVEVTYREETRTVCGIEMRPRVVEQCVSCTRLEPVTTVDPCTGCTKTTFCSVPYTKTVKVTVADAVPVERKVVIRIPVVKPIEREVEVTRLTVDLLPQPVIETRLELLPSCNPVTVPAPYTPVPAVAPFCVPPPPPHCAPPPHCCGPR